ncbi:hypothetical protein [Pseudomonas sp. BN417]|uniref:hypothetical protein n=1 Tax=Pseudomonas sp. BN417 TaxID=2567890 RepID=UPI0024553617|nr:hypothetical protein [Pseudomonas sp. BN417]
MDASTLFLYVVAFSVVAMTPGPAMLLALSNGASHGMRLASFGKAAHRVRPLAGKDARQKRTVTEPRRIPALHSVTAKLHER